MQLRSDAVKKGLARAPHRSLLKADGLTDEEMERPLVAIFNSRNDIIPGHNNLDKIAKAVKAVNDSKTAKEKADAEARAKAEQEAAAQAAAAQQAQQSQQRSYPSSGSGSNRSYSSGGWSAGSGGSGSTGGQSYSGSSSSGSSTPSNGSDDYDITQDPFFNQHTTNSSCASGGFCPIG